MIHTCSCTHTHTHTHCWDCCILLIGKRAPEFKCSSSTVTLAQRQCFFFLPPPAPIQGIKLEQKYETSTSQFYISKKNRSCWEQESRSRFGQCASTLEQIHKYRSATYQMKESEEPRVEGGLLSMWLNGTNTYMKWTILYWVKQRSGSAACRREKAHLQPASQLVMHQFLFGKHSSVTVDLIWAALKYGRQSAWSKANSFYEPCCNMLS